jgi:hypothetical protein
MHTIAEILASETRPSWQESVALVQEIASQLAPGQPVPAPDDLLLAEDGILSFGFAGESSNLQVTDLGGLLVALLTGSSAPPPLVDFANENGRPEPAHPTVEGFRRALAFYERPNRRSDLAAVAGRLAVHAQADRARNLVAQLRQKALAEPESPEPEPVARGPVARRVPTRQILMAAGLVLIVLSGGAMLRFRMLTGSTVTDPGTLRAEALPAPPADSSPSPVGSAGATPEPATATDHAVAPDPAPRPAPRSAAPRPPSQSGAATRQVSLRQARTEPRGVSTLSSSSRLPAPAPRPGPPTKVGGPRPLSAQPERPSLSVDGGAIVQPLPLPLPVPRGPVQPMRAGQADAFGVRGGLSDGVPVYSREDPDVKPPRILRQQLPSAPAPNAQTGYLEFVVDTQGNVESLNLISPTTRFHDLMLVAAAKAWKFRPALFDGRPVKYRMRVAITLDGPSD